MSSNFATIILAIVYIVGMETSSAQTPIDPCFQSLTSLGRFSASKYVRNFCRCQDVENASDILQWNEEKSAWDGAFPTSEVDLPPPEEFCSLRGMWMGYDQWTTYGEGFALMLDKPLELGKQYTFTFTYASDGYGSNNHFEPIFFTASGLYPSWSDATFLQKLPPAGNDWLTSSITITVFEHIAQNDWIGLYTVESSGIVLSNCEVSEEIVKKYSENDISCYGTRSYFKLQKTKPTLTNINGIPAKLHPQ